MPVPSFVICEACGEVYPKPQDGPCPFCGDDEPVWHEWIPAEQDLSHGIGWICDIIVGLLNLLDDCGELQDHDGRLYGAVVDALVVVSTLEPPPYADFYTMPGEEVTHDPR